MKRFAIPLGIALVSLATIAFSVTPASAQRRGIGIGIGPQGLYIGPNYGGYGGYGPYNNYYGRYGYGNYGYGNYGYPYYGNRYGGWSGYYGNYGNNYNMNPYNSYYPPTQQVTPPSATAQVQVIVPDANAEVWFQGVKMTQTGTNRTFTTPMLQGGYSYDYEVTARWMQNGQPMTQTRHVNLHPGESMVVDFNQPY